MSGRLRRRRVAAVAVAACGIGVLTACGGAANQGPATTSSGSVSPTPTDKGRPNGPNQFSPTPIAPLTPTGNPGRSGVAQHQ